MLGSLFRRRSVEEQAAEAISVGGAMGLLSVDLLRLAMLEKVMRLEWSAPEAEIGVEVQRYASALADPDPNRAIANRNDWVEKSTIEWPRGAVTALVREIEKPWVATEGQKRYWDNLPKGVRESYLQQAELMFREINRISEVD